MIETGLQIGPYTLLDRLGRSRWTSVYSAAKEGSTGKFAIKIFDLNGSLEADIGTPSEDIWRKRFDLEAEILQKIRHPNIIALHDSGRLEDGRPYHVMPFVVANLPYEIGGDVKNERAMERLAPRRRPKPLNTERAVQLLHQIVDALAAVHAMGVVHRDLKPGNVLLTRKKSGRVKLCDFGMARWGDRTFDVVGETIGTKRYISPEQLKDPSVVDARADIYSFGVIMYRMFTGKLPFGDNTTIAWENSSAPDFWDGLIAACLSPEPLDRPENAMELQTLFRGF